ncbi:MAG: hypothetical protein KER_00838 [Kerstersia gyiorum]
MRIPHGCLQILMSKNTLQSQNIAAIDHEMAGKGVTQHMGKLPHRQLNTGAFNGLLERASTAGEYCPHIPMLGMMGKNLILHAWRECQQFRVQGGLNIRRKAG